MIYINEKSPIKVSGLSSLFISFNFNMDIVNILKNCSQYFYDKKTHVWEVSANNLAFLLDEFTYIDDIELNLLPEDTNKEKLTTTIQHKYPPFQHQQEGIEFGLNHDNWLLLDEAGLGKTLQIIYLAEELKVQKGLEHCLIICGVNALKPNWKAEIEKFSTLDCKVLGERHRKNGNTYYASMTDRASEILNPIKEFFLILNIESIRSEEVMKAFKKSPNNFGMIVVDECHKCKEPTTQQARNMLKLKAEKKIGLTGTLIMNKPLDCYTILRWIGTEKSDYTNFKHQYCVYGGFGGHQIIGYKNLNSLKEELQFVSLRRTKAQVRDLPPRTVVNRYIEMDDGHRKFYENVKNLVKEECDKVELTNNNVLSLTTRLRQATASPETLTSENIISTKVQQAVDLAMELLDQGDKVVIMSTFKQPVYTMAKMLKDYNPLIGTGDEDAAKVFERNKLFQEDPEYKLFIATGSKCGTGLNFNAANYMICIDTPWNPALQDQIESRIDRINNTSPAFIYKFICKDTIDEKVEDLLQVKQAMGDFMVDNKADEKVVSILRQYIQDL